MATGFTIGQISAATAITDDDYIEIETSGISKRATIQQIAAFARPCGEVFDMAYQKTVSETFPAVALWDADHTISDSNYPILVPELRDAVVSVSLTAGTVVTSINCNATGGSILSSVDSAFTIMVNALTEEYAIQSAYSIAVTIGGTEYTITSVSSTITISGTIATGATTLSVYPHRIVGTTNSAIVFRDSGRATLTHDGNTRLAGMRRRNRMQGHRFLNGVARNTTDDRGANYGSDTTDIPGLSTTGYITTSAGSPTRQGYTSSPIADGTNGTPRTGANTEPDSNVVYRYMWAQQYIA